MIGLHVEGPGNAQSGQSDQSDVAGCLQGVAAVFQNEAQVAVGDFEADRTAGSAVNTEESFDAGDAYQQRFALFLDSKTAAQFDKAADGQSRRAAELSDVGAIVKPDLDGAGRCADDGIDGCAKAVDAGVHGSGECQPGDADKSRGAGGHNGIFGFSADGLVNHRTDLTV